MKCPRCFKEGAGIPCYVVYGIKDDQTEVIASGKFEVGICDGVVMLQEVSEVPIEGNTTIITPDPAIILPQGC